ncbi:MAG: hypothetical protein ACYDH5_07350 [Acidimicrobiales bacterium]
MLLPAFLSAFPSALLSTAVSSAVPQLARWSDAANEGALNNARAAVEERCSLEASARSSLERIGARGPAGTRETRASRHPGDGGNDEPGRLAQVA